MSLTRLQTIWLFVVCIIVGSLPLVIVLSGIVPALTELLVDLTSDATSFGILISSNDLGNVYYLSHQWLLRSASGRHENLIRAAPRLDRLNPRSAAADNSFHHVHVSLPGAEVKGEYDFLNLVWNTEEQKTGLDFTKLYTLGHNLPVNTKLIEHTGDYACPTDVGPVSFATENVSLVFEVRPSFDWYPGGTPEQLEDGIIFHVDSEEFRMRSCVLGVPERSSQMADNEWCADLTSIPGSDRMVPFIEPRESNYSIRVNVTGRLTSPLHRITNDCELKPLALNDRTSYYDSPFSSDAVSLHALDVEKGPDQAMAIILARSPLFSGSVALSNYSISIINVCHSFAGDPTSTGASLLIDYDTNKPLTALGGARFIRIWTQTNAKDGSKNRMMAYITLCGRNTQSLVISQLVTGPLIETGACTNSTFLPRTYYVKKLRQIGLNSGCVDPLNNHDCPIYCQAIYDFSIRPSQVSVDDEVWAPKDNTFWLVTLTVCSAGWRFDRIHLPILNLSALPDKAPELEVHTKFLWQPAVEPTTRLQFDNNDAPNESPLAVDGIWHSQVARMLITVNSTLEQPYKEFCGYADRNMIWELRIEELVNTKACLRRWLNYPSRLPHAIRSIAKGASIMAVRDFGIFMFNTSCSYCDAATFPITKIPRTERLLLGRFDGITGDPHVVNLSPIEVISDVLIPQILYYWDAGNNSVRWIRVPGVTEFDWGVIHTAKTLFVPRFAPDRGPLSMAWSTATDGTKLVLGSFYARSILAQIVKMDSSCQLRPQILAQTRSPMGALYASGDGELLVWSEPLRESLLIANAQNVMAGDIPATSSLTWRRLTCLNGKVFSSIGYSPRKKQIFMSAPEEGSVYSMGIQSENYNIVFRAADRIGIGDILKALRPNHLYVDPASDAVYFTALPAINITSYYDAAWGNASLYDQMFYSPGQYGWKRADDTGGYSQMVDSPSQPMYSAQNTYPVNSGPTNLANSVWVLRPNFSVKTLMTDPSPYYTNVQAHIVTIYGHNNHLICVERRVDRSRTTRFRVIRFPLLTFSPEIFSQVKVVETDGVQILVDWSTGNINSLLAPLAEPGLYDNGATGEEVAEVNRSVFGWIAFGLLITHLSVATAYNFKMTRSPLNGRSESGNT